MVDQVTPTYNQCLVQGLENQRTNRLVAASQVAAAPVAHITKVWQICFHRSQAYAIAWVEFSDGVRDIVWAEYQGKTVRLELIEVSSAMQRILQRTTTQVTFRINSRSITIQAKDHDGIEYVHECQAPE